MEVLPKKTVILKLKAIKDNARIITIENFDNEDFLNKVKKYESFSN